MLRFALTRCRAVGIDDSIPSNLSNPEVKSHDWIVEVFFEPAACFDHHILHDITYVNTLLNFAVQSHLNKPTNGTSVLLQKLVDRIRITGPRSIEQGFSLIIDRPD